MLTTFFTMAIAFGFLQLLFNLFPYCGFQVMVSYVAHLIIAILISLILATVISSNFHLIVKLLFSVVLMILMFLLQIKTYTQDSGASTPIKILNSIKASKNYKNIDENKFTSYNRQEQIVYNSKFNKNSKYEYFTIWNKESQIKHHITKLNNDLIYDKELLLLNKTKMPNQISEIQTDGTKRNFEIESIDKLFEIKSGGYKDWSVRHFDNKYVGYETILYNLNRKKDNR